MLYFFISCLILPNTLLLLHLKFLPIMFLMDLVMIFSPLIGFVDQYKKIKETKNSEIFSTNVSLILIICNTLRIFFWIGKRFENVMLYQSIAMIIGQYFMLHVCHQFSQNKKDSSSLFNFSAFWKWNSYFTYSK